MKSPTQSTIKSHCPECGELAFLPTDIEVGELIDCEHCGVELEVRGTDPAILMVFEEEEK